MAKQPLVIEELILYSTHVCLGNFCGGENQLWWVEFILEEVEFLSFSVELN